MCNTDYRLIREFQYEKVYKKIFISVFVYSTNSFSGAQEIIVSVSDFNVESKNEKYAYIGKGISTLVAGELRRTKTIKLLERSQMNKIMEEQKLSLLGMVDEAHQVELGKLMAADYIVFGDYAVKDNVINSRLGYSFPYGEKIGLGFGIFGGFQDFKVNHIDHMDELNFQGETTSSLFSGPTYIGGSASIGVRLRDWYSIGTSVLVWLAINSGDPGVSDQLIGTSDAIIREGLFFSIYPGIMIRDPGGNLTFDINVGYTNQKVYYADYAAGEIALDSKPLVIDSSFTYGLLNQRLFLGLKGISDIYMGRRWDMLFV